jgi:hypothetical protein
MRRERNPGSASAAVAPSSSFPSRQCCAPCPGQWRAVGVRWLCRPALCRSQAAGRSGRGLPVPSPKGAGAWLPG